jgi:hypothetical protein
MIALPRTRSFVRSATFALAALAAVDVLQIGLVDAFFPIQSRFATSFSSVYLHRYLKAVAAQPPQAVFLGDGLLAGFGVKPQDTAVARLAASGCRCRNLAYIHGTPLNYYALALLLRAYGVHPEVAVIEIDQLTFNPSYAQYRAMPWAVSELSWPMLSQAERTGLKPPPSGIRQAVRRAVDAASPLFAMRIEMHEALFGRPPALAPLDAPARSRAFDLQRLDEGNFSVRYLGRTVDVLHSMNANVVAFMAPTNHAVFGRYVDTAAFRANKAFLRRFLDRRGARVLDLDDAVPASGFADDVHLDAAGQLRLATLLAPVLPPSPRPAHERA